MYCSHAHPIITLSHHFPTHLQHINPHQRTTNNNSYTRPLSSCLKTTHTATHPLTHTHEHQLQKNLASALLRSMKSTGFVT